MHGHLILFGHLLAGFQAFYATCAAEKQSTGFGHKIFPLEAGSETRMYVFTTKNAVHGHMHFGRDIEEFPFFSRAFLAELDIQDAQFLRDLKANDKQRTRKK